MNTEICDDRKFVENLGVFEGNSDARVAEQEKHGDFSEWSSGQGSHGEHKGRTDDGELEGKVEDKDGVLGSEGLGQVEEETARRPEGVALEKKKIPRFEADTWKHRHIHPIWTIAEVL